MGNENPDHIVMVGQDHEGRDHEQEPGHSHPDVHEEHWSFVLLIHLFLVVNMVSSHFENQSIVSTFPSQLVESLGLIVPESFWRKTVEVAVVGVVGGTALESIHRLYDNNIS